MKLIPNLLYILAIAINFIAAIVILASGEISIIILGVLLLGLIHLRLLTKQKNGYGLASVISFLVIPLILLLVYLRPHTGADSLGFAIELYVINVAAYIVSLVFGLISIFYSEKKV